MKATAIVIKGVKVKVRELSSAAQSEKLADPGEAFYAAMVACCLDPDTGEPIFTEADIPSLKASARRGMKALSDAVMRVNGYDTEATEKNSAAGPAAG
jgi:hypothetical protein